FLDPHTVEIVADGQRVGDMSRKREPSRAPGAGAGPGTPPRDPPVTDADPLRVRGDRLLIACGTRPAHDPRIPVDGQRVHDTETMEQLEGIPDRLIVVGAGVIGLEYACMAAALGRVVTVIDQRAALLDFVDREIVERLLVALRRNGVTFRLGEKVVSMEQEVPNPVVILLESGKKVQGDALLYAVGRQANTDQLALEAAGLTADARGLLGVHAIGESATEIIHIGQAVLALGGTVEYFRDAVFNYPALAEAYKVAALNGLNKL